MKNADWIYNDVYTGFNHDINFKRIEKALGFKLFFWQKYFIVYGNFRGYGKTTAKILRILLNESDKPLELRRPTSFKENYFQQNLIDIYCKLKENGIPCRTIIRKGEKKK